MTDTPNAGVARTFASYPPPLRRRLMALRELVLDTADAVPRDALALCIQAALTYHRRKTP